MRLVSVIPDVLHAQAQGVRPQVVGMQEVVFPCKTILLPYGVVVSMSEDDARTVMKRYGKAGVVEVPEGMPDNDPGIQELIGAAKEQRYQHLGVILTNYRNEQAARQASGVPIVLPGMHMRAMVKEMKKLQAEIVATNPVLREQFQGLKDEGPVPEDPMAAELRDFGFTEKSAPMVPGVTMGELPL